MKHRYLRPVLCAGLLATAAPALAADEDLRREIETLKQQNKVMMERLDATSEMLESSRPAAGHGSGTDRVSIGGYGELHYNNLDNQLPGGDDIDMLDFHRFVLTFGYEFTDSVRFFSEVELEHALAGDGEPGEVELEQAYVEFDLNDKTSAKGGVFLLPVGILNQTHEPPTFYGVERNPVETYIIPTTWWAAGAELTGRFGQGYSYSLGVHEGLKLDPTGSMSIRSGRQKSAEADASNLASTAQLKYTGVPGLELAVTYQYQGDMSQVSGDGLGSGDLISTHAIYNHGSGFGLRALYATWSLQGSAPAANGANEQTGWYIEPSYRLNDKWGVFARYNEWDNQAGNSSIDSEYTQVNAGVNYWPIEDVVLKFDVQNQDAPPGSDEYDGFNLGIGFQF